MKVIITGASGLLGRAIKQQFDRIEGWTVQGWGFNRLEGGLKKVDLRDNESIIGAIDDFQPDVVVHSAAERRPDVVVKHEAETTALNVTASETIAKEMDKRNGFVLYISTDYVFDGTSPPYTTTDTPNPLNKYGVSKLQGERVTTDNCARSGVLRVPVMYGELQFIKESAVLVLFPLLQDTANVVKVSDYEQR